MKDTKSENMIWGVVHSGALTLIGAFRKYQVVPKLSTEQQGSRTLDQLRADTDSVVLRFQQIDIIKKDFELGKCFELEPVMELAAPLQQVRQQAPEGQRVGVAKSPIPMPYGFTTGKARLIVKPDALAFLDEMSEDDQRLYQAFINNVSEAETSERASRAGLTLVKGGLHG